MNDLKDALDVLYELNRLRDRAKELREQGRLALKEKYDTRPKSVGKEKSKPDDQELREAWISSDNTVEAALLVKVLNHRDMSEDDNENDISEAPPELKNKLTDLHLDDLFPSSDDEAREKDERRGDRAIPVLVAARVMQALVTRSKMVFSRATMLCYYRIVRELYIAAPPDWTIGAARAGTGGNTSAFVTGECIRAIFAFEDAIKRTVTFFQQTHRLLGRHDLLSEMLSGFENIALAEGRAASKTGESVDHLHLYEWANGTIERMWFDWYISTNPRHGNMALHVGEEENQLLFHPADPVDMKGLAEFKERLRGNLKEAVRAAKTEIIAARREITERNKKRAALLKRNQESSPQEQRREPEKELRDHYRAESAHRFALTLIKDAEFEAQTAAANLKDESKPIKDVLDQLSQQFERISYRIHRVLEPAKRYIRTVLNREVAASALGRFDAGELVFAAASFGAVTNWQPSELRARACKLLVDAMPESGRLPTTRPFQSTLRGHRMLPIGCEMTRSLAQVLQKTGDEIEPQVVRRMLNIFEEKLIVLDRSKDQDRKRVAWNFDGSPDPNTPCVWVTAVSVLAIDRVVRMLNDRINSVIFKHFEVIGPEKPHSPLNLNDLVYPDYDLSKNRPSMALRLEQMRAHVMRVTLPPMYKDGKGKKERGVFGNFSWSSGNRENYSG